MCEYIIKPKNEGKVLIKKTALAASYFLLAAILIFLVITLAPLYVLIPLILLSVAVTALVAFITWRFVCVEYEICIGGGNLTVTTIYGRSVRRQLVNLNINSIFEMGEYGDGAYEEISKISLQKNYICVSSLASPVIYYALFDEGKDRSILYFDATDEAIRLLRISNSGAFRASDNRIKKIGINKEFL